METLISLRDELGSYEANNERIINAHEKKEEVNVVVLQSLSNL